MNETAARARTLERFLKAKMVLFSMKSLRHFEMGEFDQGARCVNWSCWCIQKSFEVRAAMLLRKAADGSGRKNAPGLAENQIPNHTGRPVELRWENGSPEARCVCGESDCDKAAWVTWSFNALPGWCEAGDAWFRERCPTDRYITDDWSVLEFRMLDDGEAETIINGVAVRTMVGSMTFLYSEKSLGGPFTAGLHGALHRFRDAEQAKWDLRWDEGDRLIVSHPEIGGNFMCRGWESEPWCDRAMKLVPAHIRTKAEAMWRMWASVEPQKVTFVGKWKEISKDNSRVTFEAYKEELPDLPNGPLFITIEPMGGK
jgi:hypothetical protein